MFGQQINLSVTGRKFYQPDKRRIHYYKTVVYCAQCVSLHDWNHFFNWMWLWQNAMLLFCDMSILVVNTSTYQFQEATCGQGITW